MHLLNIYIFILKKFGISAPIVFWGIRERFFEIIIVLKQQKKRRFFQNVKDLIEMVSGRKN